MKRKATVFHRIGFAAALVLCLLLTGVLSSAAQAGSITTAAIKKVCSDYGFKTGAYWTYDYNAVGKTQAVLDAAATKGYKASKVPYGSGSYRSKYYPSSNTHYGEYIFQGGRQCFGFANFIGYKLTGKVPTSSWTKYTSVAQVEAAGGLQVGDVIRSSGHSAMVLTVSGGKITTAECWGGSKNKISVGGKFNGSANTLRDIANRYGFTAVYRYKGAKPDVKLGISASGEKYPAEGSDLAKGKNFGLRGVYTAAGGTITKVTATVRDQNGKTNFSFTATPKSAKYDVNGTKGTNGKNLNNTVLFNKLAAGNYTMTVTVTAEGGGKQVKKEVVRHFTVGGGAKGGISAGAVGAAAAAVKTPGPWGEWTTSRKGDRSGLDEETRHHWWAAECKKCGAHNPYWGSNVKCNHCGAYLSSGNVRHANVYTPDKGSVKTLNGRGSGRTIDGKNYWYCEIQYRYRTR